jgi:hypothetical protein
MLVADIVAGPALSAGPIGGGAMGDAPTHDSVRVHNDQGSSPIPPRNGEQHPKTVGLGGGVGDA